MSLTHFDIPSNQPISKYKRKLDDEDLHDGLKSKNKIPNLNWDSSKQNGNYTEPTDRNARSPGSTEAAGFEHPVALEDLYHKTGEFVAAGKRKDKPAMRSIAQCKLCGQKSRIDHIRKHIQVRHKELVQKQEDLLVEESCINKLNL